jgi:hypothetical protein
VPDSCITCQPLYRNAVEASLYSDALNAGDPLRLLGQPLINLYNSNAISFDELTSGIRHCFQGV